MYKSLFIAVIVSATVFSPAANANESRRQGSQHGKMAERLALSEAQSDKVGAIMDSYHKESREAAEALRTKQREMREAMTKEMKSVLSEEQYEQWTKMAEARKTQHKKSVKACAKNKKGVKTSTQGKQCKCTHNNKRAQQQNARRAVYKQKHQREAYLRSAYMNLSMDQQEKIDHLREELFAQRNKERREMLTHRKAERQSIQDEMKKILTPEQYAKWKQRMAQAKRCGARQGMRTN